MCNESCGYVFEFLPNLRNIEVNDSQRLVVVHEDVEVLVVVVERLQVVFAVDESEPVVLV